MTISTCKKQWEKCNLIYYSIPTRKLSKKISHKPVWKETHTNGSFENDREDEGAVGQRLAGIGGLVSGTNCLPETIVTPPTILGLVLVSQNLNFSKLHLLL